MLKYGLLTVEAIKAAEGVDENSVKIGMPEENVAHNPTAEEFKQAVAEQDSEMETNKGFLKVLRHMHPANFPVLELFCTAHMASRLFMQLQSRSQMYCRIRNSSCRGHVIVHFCQHSFLLQILYVDDQSLHHPTFYTWVINS